MKFFNLKNNIKLLTLLLLSGLSPAAQAADDLQILNVSYDPTREFYEDYNKIFAAKWLKEHQQNLKIKQSNGGSGKQARSVIDGLPADVVTLALSYDIDNISSKGKLLAANWQKELPNNSSPSTSTIVFLVHAGNPKQIKDWGDLLKTDVQVITPNPKTSGGARWNYMAAWGYALQQPQADEKSAQDFISKLYKQVPILDAGARGATTTFAQRGIGDVLITWENEAHLAKREFTSGKFEIIYPSISIKAEPPVAVVEKNAQKHGTSIVAKEYLTYLYSNEAQELAAKHFFRPSNAEIFAQHKKDFPELKMTSISDFGGWEAVQKKHFADGGVFDEIYKK